MDNIISLDAIAIGRIIYVHEYKHVLTPKDYQSINMVWYYCCYTPYFQTYARIDLCIFTLFQLYCLYVET